MYKAIALKELYDEDWKTQSALKYPNIPKGAEVNVVDYIDNYYGHFVRVEYNNQFYYVKEKDIKRKEERKCL